MQFALRARRERAETLALGAAGYFVKPYHLTPFMQLGKLIKTMAGGRENTACPKTIDFYALSCGSFRKQARNLIETAQRKSQAFAEASIISSATLES